LEEATQAALEASSAAEAQHTAMSKQLAADKRNVQEQMDQVSKCSIYSKCKLRVLIGQPQYTSPSGFSLIDAQMHSLFFFCSCFILRVSMHCNDWRHQRCHPVSQQQMVDEPAGNGDPEVNVDDC